MYRVNTLMRNVLISVDEVLFHAPTKHSMDPRMIQHSIIIAEERFIRPELGDKLYLEMINSKNVVITNANKSAMQTLITAIPDEYSLVNGDVINAWENMSTVNQDLWKWILWKLTAEAVMMLATPEAFVQFAAEGVVHTSPPASPLVNSGNTTPDLRSVKWSMDKKMQDRIDPLTDALHAYLCLNKTNYPLYTKECEECNPDGSSKTSSRKLDWITSIYDDEDD